MSNNPFRNTESSFRNEGKDIVPTGGGEQRAFANSLNNNFQAGSSVVGTEAYEFDRSTYEKYMGTVRPYVGLSDLNLMRARNQSGGEQFVRFLGQAVIGEIIGGAIMGVGSIFELPAAIATEITGGSADFNNAMIRFGNDIIESTKEHLPIYRQRPGKAWDMSDSGWWFENGVSIASSIGMMIPGMAAVKAVSMIGKLGSAFRLTKGAQQIASVLGNAAVMRNAENMREGFAVVNETKLAAMQKFDSDVDFDEWLLTPAGQEYLRDQTDTFGGHVGKESAAEWIAAKAGWRAYAINSANIVFDVVQSAALFKSNWLTRTNATKSVAVQKAMGQAAATTAAVGEKAAVASVGIGGRVAANARVIASILGEGVEESVNFFGEQEGARYGHELLELGKGDSILAGVSRKAGEYTRNPHMWEQFFWGAVGGGVFEGAAGLVNALTADKDGKRTDEIKVAEIEMRNKALKQFNAQAKVIIDNLNNKKISENEAKSLLAIAQEGVKFNMAFSAANAGNMDLLLESINDGTMKEAILADLPLDAIKDSEVLTPDALIEDIRKDALRVEKFYREAVDRYSVHNVEAASRYGLVQKYTEHKYNIAKRDASILHAENRIAGAVEIDGTYQALTKEGKDVRTALNVKVLETMASDPAFVGYKEFIADALSNEKKKVVGPVSTTGVQTEVSQMIREIYLHQFSKQASLSYLEKATKKGYIGDFNKAVVQTIETGKKQAETAALEAWKQELSDNTEAMSSEEKLAAYKTERGQQTEEEYTKYLDAEIAKLEKVVSKEKAVAGKKGKAPKSATGTDVVKVIAADLQLAENQVTQMEDLINEAITNADRDTLLEMQGVLDMYMQEKHKNKETVDFLNRLHTTVSSSLQGKRVPPVKEKGGEITETNEGTTDETQTDETEAAETGSKDIAKKAEDIPEVGKRTRKSRAKKPVSETKVTSTTTLESLAGSLIKDNHFARLMLEEIKNSGINVTVEYTDTVDPLNPIRFNHTKGTITVTKSFNEMSKGEQQMAVVHEIAHVFDKMFLKVDDALNSIKQLKTKKDSISGLKLMLSAVHTASDPVAEFFAYAISDPEFIKHLSFFANNKDYINIIFAQYIVAARNLDDTRVANALYSIISSIYADANLDINGITTQIDRIRRNNMSDTQKDKVKSMIAEVDALEKAELAEKVPYLIIYGLHYGDYTDTAYAKFYDHITGETIYEESRGGTVSPAIRESVTSKYGKAIFEQASSKEAQELYKKIKEKYSKVRSEIKTSAPTITGTVQEVIARIELEQSAEKAPAPASATIPTATQSEFVIKAPLLKSFKAKAIAAKIGKELQEGDVINTTYESTNPGSSSGQVRHTTFEVKNGRLEERGNHAFNLENDGRKFGNLRVTRGTTKTDTAKDQPKDGKASNDIVLNYTATPPAQKIADIFGIDIGNVPPTGPNGTITVDDVKRYTQQKGLSPITEIIAADDLVSHVAHAEGANLYLFPVMDGINNGVIDATFLNQNLRNRFGDGAMQLTQEQAEAAVRKILSFDLNTNSTVEVTKENNGFVVRHQGVIIGFLNNLKKIEDTMSIIAKFEEMTSVDQIKIESYSGIERTYAEWRLQDLKGEAVTPYSLAMTRMKKHWLATATVRDTIGDKGKARFKVKRKTGGTVINKDTLTPLRQVRKTPGEIFRKESSGVLVSTMNPTRKYVRNENATAYVNKDQDYSEGNNYILIPVANSIPGDINTMVPVWVDAVNVSETLMDNEIYPLLEELIALGRKGTKMLSDPRVIEIKERLSHFINVESYQGKSKNYMFVTDDKIQFSFRNDKGKVFHMQIHFKGKWNDIPFIGMTDQKQGGKNIGIMKDANGKVVNTVTFGSTRFKKLVYKAFTGNKLFVNGRKLGTSDKTFDGKTYGEWLYENDMLQVPFDALRDGKGDVMYDDRGNALPNVTGKHDNKVRHNLVLTIDTQPVHDLENNVPVIKLDPGKPEEPKFRKVQEGVEEMKMTSEEALVWWNETFAGVEFDPNVANLIVRGGVEAWGIFEDAMVKMYKEAPGGTVFHEAYHVVHWLYLTEAQRGEIMAEAKTKWGNKDHITLEELIADEFMKYMITRKANEAKLGNKTRNFFQRIYDWIVSWFSKKGYVGADKMQRLFNKIDSGGFKYEPDPRMVEFAKGIKRTRRVEGFTLQEQQEVVGVIAKHLIDFSLDNPGITVKELRDRVNIKNNIKVGFEMLRDELTARGKEQHLDRVLNNFDKFFADSVRYVSQQFNIDINEAIDADVQLEKRWNDAEAFASSSKDTVSNEVKRMLLTTERMETGSFLGLPMYINFNQIYPYLQNIMHGATSTNEMLDRLHNISKFDPVFDAIAGKLEENENMLAAWYTNFRKANPVRHYVKIDANGVEVDVANKNTGYYAIANMWGDGIETLMESMTSEELTQLGEDVETMRKRLAIQTAKFDTNIESIVNTTADILVKMGINISPRQVMLTLQEARQNEQDEIMGLLNVEEYYEMVYNQLMLGMLQEIKSYAKDENHRFRSYKRLNKLAQSVSKYQYDMVEVSSFNINGDITFGFSLPTFLSNFYDKIDAVFNAKTSNKAKAKEELLIALKEHAMDPANNYSNWLWNTKGTNGILELVNGEKNATGLTPDHINMVNLEKMTHSYLEGIKNTITKEAETYDTMPDNSWMFTQLAMYLSTLREDGGNTVRVNIPIPADSGNIYFIESFRYVGVNNNGTVNRRYDNGQFNQLWEAVYNTVFQEIERIKAARNLLYYREDGAWKVKEHKLGVEPGNDKYVDYTKLEYRYHYNAYDADGLPVIEKDGKPTGRVFGFYNIRSVGDIKVTVNGHEFSILEDGIYEADTYENKDIEKAIKAEIGNKVDAFIREEVARGEELYRFLEEEMDSVSGYATNFNTFKQFIAEYMLNAYLSNVEQFNFFVGTQPEYKSDDDTDKRVKQIRAPKAAGVYSQPTFNGANIRDIKLATTIYPKLVKEVGSALKKETSRFRGMDYKMANMRNKNATRNEFEQAIYEIVGPYLNTVLADGQGYVSLSRYKDILKANGRWAPKYERLFTKLESGEKMTAEDLTTILQPLKGFYYARRFDPYLGKMVSTQLKYSTMPLVPALVKGTEAEQLMNWMDKNNLGEVFFESAEKNGSTMIIDITDGKGHIDQKKLDQYSVDNGYEFREYYNEDWGLQLDVPDHIVDETNKLFTTLIRTVFTNIDFDTMYDVGGRDMSGKEMFDHFMNMLHTNVSQSAIDLLSDLDAINKETGEVGMVNKQQFANIVKRQLEKRGMSTNYSFVMEMDGEQFNLPLFIPTMASKLENLAWSLFENNVVSQRFNGGSAVILTTPFITSKSKTQERSIDELDDVAIEGINWLDKKKGNHKLRTIEIDGNGNVTKAEALLPAWSKKFFKKQIVDGKEVFVLDDINNIPEEVRTGVWYRIPYEGKHSALVVEVVGFLPSTAGNAIILPQEAITQSGEDADIDKRFGMLPSFEVGQDGYSIIEYTEDINDAQLYERWKRTKLAQGVKNSFIVNPTEEFKKYTTQLKRFNTIKDKMKAGLGGLKGLRQTVKEAIAEYANTLGIVGEEATVQDVFDAIGTRIAEANEALDGIQAAYETRWLTPEEDVEMQDLQRRLNEYKTRHIGYAQRFAATMKQLNEDVSGMYEKVERQNQIVDKYRELRNVEIDAALIDVYDTIPVEMRNTKEARDNEVLKVIYAIHHNRKHYREMMTPAAFTEGGDVVKEVNALVKEAKGAVETTNNPVTVKGQLHYRKQNIAGRALKGMAVNSTVFLGTAQTTRMMTTDKLAVPVMYDADKYSMKEAIKKHGKENVTDYGDKFLVHHKRYGWNADGSFTNMDGKMITKSAGEVLAQILDIVKEGVPHNVNTYTFNMYANMINLGISIRYASLLIRQPFINDLTKFYFSKQSLLEESDNREISDMKKDYQTKLFLARKMLGKLPNTALTRTLEDRYIKQGYVYITRLDAAKAKKSMDEFAKDYLNDYYNYKADGEFAQTDEQLKQNILLGEKYGDITPENVSKLDRKELVEYNNFLRGQLLLSEQFLKYKEGGEGMDDLRKVMNLDNRKGVKNFESSATIQREMYKSAFYPDFQGNPTEARVVVNVDGKTVPAVAAVYPDAIPDFAGMAKESVYPLLNAHFKYGYDLGASLFQEEFLKYKPGVRSAIDQVLTELNMFVSEDNIGSVFNYIQFAILGKFPMFENADKIRILGVDKRVDVKQQMTLAEFNELSTANKLVYIKQKYANELATQSHFLNHLLPKVKRNDVDRRGFHSIDFVNIAGDEVTADDLTTTFQELWEGHIFGVTDVIGRTKHDPMLRSLAEDLIVYNYFTSGMTMKMNSFASLIPTPVLKEIGLGDYLYKQAKLAEDDAYFAKNIGNVTDYYVRNNSGNRKIVPFIDITKENTKWSFNNVTQILSVSQPALEQMSNKLQTAEYVSVPIIIHKKEGDKIVKIKVGERLYRRSDNVQGQVVKYMPINKLGSGFLMETGDKSIIASNNTPSESEAYHHFTENGTLNPVINKRYPQGEEFYAANHKDMKMFVFATAFIGDAVIANKQSATALYKRLFGERANMKEYNAGDLVMVSVQGKRGGVTYGDLKKVIVREGRLQGPYANIYTALDNGATIMIASHINELGQEIRDYNREYNIGDRIVRNHLIEMVNKGEIAAKIENGIMYFASSEGNMQTVSRKLQTLNQNEIDGMNDGNIKCAV
jgi:hypothetical protein